MKLAKTKHLKIKLLAGSAIIAASALAGFFLLNSNKAPEIGRDDPSGTTSSNRVKDSEAKKPDQPSYQLTFSAVGDLLAHDSVVKQAKTADGYDFKPYFAKVKNLMVADVVFCNPETPVAGADFGISGYPSFNAPTEFARDMVEAGGCNLINLATNHIADKGVPGIAATLDVWDKLPILAHAGANRNQAEQNGVKYFTKNGLKVAFLAFADFSNLRSIGEPYLNLYHNRELAERLVKEAREQADAVIVSLHWGTEDSTKINADQISTADFFSQLGVDVIIGTGPHVLQKVDWLTNQQGHKTLVWYSLGNFLSSQLYINQLTGGVAKFTISKRGDKIEVAQPSFATTLMSYDWSAEDRAAMRLNTRSNLELTPLELAENQAAKMGSSLPNRQDFVHTTLTDQVSITP